MKVKNKPLVSVTDLVTLLFFPPVSLLTRLPSPAVHHPPDMNLILNLFISLHLRLVSFLFRFFSHSLFCYSAKLSEQPLIKRTFYSGGRNTTKTNNQTKN